LLTLPAVATSLENHSEVFCFIAKFLGGARDVEGSSVALSCAEDHNVAFVWIDSHAHGAEKGTGLVD
jgi:hypothetical protein